MGRCGAGHWQWHFANIFAFSRVLLPALSPEINFACTCDCSASRKQNPPPLPFSPLPPLPRPRTRQSGAAGLVPGTLLRAAASAPGKSTTYAVYIKHKAEHKTQNKHAEQTDKEGTQIKREGGRKGDRDKQPNATQSAAAVIDKFLALPCPVTQLEQGRRTGNSDRGRA